MTGSSRLHMTDEALDFEQQLSLARAIELLDLFTIHEANGGPSIAETWGAPRVLASLSDALDIAWPDRQPPEDLDAYMVDARARTLERLRADKKAAMFVAAVDWNSGGRAHVLEHLRADVEQIVGGLSAWHFVEGLDGIAGGEPLRRLVEAGIAIKIRAVGQFLTGAPPRKSYEDHEITAAQFFTAGTWGEIRSPEASSLLVTYYEHVNRQIAHLTSTRPRVEDVDRYGTDLHWLLAQVLILLGQFGMAVDRQLVPEWLPAWAGQIGRDLYPHDYFAGPADAG